MKKKKKLLFGASLLVALTLAGCTATTTPEDASTEDSTEQVDNLTPLVIAEPGIVQVEDDKFNTEELQANLAKINEGERPDDYTPYSEDERVDEFIEGEPKYDDDAYQNIDPKDLHEGTHFVYIGRKTCPYCTMLRQNLDPVIGQLGFVMDMVDTDNKEDEAYMMENFGLETVPQIAVFHDGKVVATFPQENMYLEGGADYTSLANGMGDLINIYLNYKHDLSTEETTEDAETSEDTTATDDEDTTATDDATVTE